MKKIEANISIRHAEAEHLLLALEGLSSEKKKNITHTNLVKRITLIRNAWKKTEQNRKKRKQAALQSRAFKPKNNNHK